MWRNGETMVIGVAGARQHRAAKSSSVSARIENGGGEMAGGAAKWRATRSGDKAHREIG